MRSGHQQSNVHCHGGWSSNWGVVVVKKSLKVSGEIDGSFLTWDFNNGDKKKMG